MKSKEGAGGTSTALLTLLCAAAAAAQPLGIFTRNHHGITHPLQAPSTHHHQPLLHHQHYNFSSPAHSSSPPFSLQEKLYQADHSHSRAICNSTKQIVRGASQITKCEGYGESSMC